MRDLREEQGLTLKHVAGCLGLEYSILSRYERGILPFARSHVEALLDVYRRYDPRERQLLLGWAQDAWRAQHIDFHESGKDRSLVDVVWLEFRAGTIGYYAANQVPDLLRTPEYARAVARHRLGGQATFERADRHVKVIMDRQRVLRRREPAPQVQVLLEECVLHRPCGDRGVWRGQLDHLAKAAVHPGVQVNVLPADAGDRDGGDGGFTVFGVPDPTVPDHVRQVAHIDLLGGPLLLEDAHAEGYTAVFDRLRRAALDPDRSADLIGRYAAPVPAGGPG